MSQIGSGVWVSASFQKMPALVGRLWSGPCLVAKRADVMPADRVDRSCWTADRTDLVFTHTRFLFTISCPYLAFGEYG